MKSWAGPLLELMGDKPIRRRTWTAIKILAYLRTEGEPGVFSEPLDSVPGS